MELNAIETKQNKTKRKERKQNIAHDIQPAELISLDISSNLYNSLYLF